MTIQDRRARQQSAVRQAILAAARDIARADGWQAVTIRKIADRIEYSTPVIYEHFPNKQGILMALADQGFRLMLECFRQVASSESDPVQALQRMAAAYWTFAWDYPELYQVMHGLDGIPFGTPDTPHEAQELFRLVEHQVTRLPGYHGAEAAVRADVDLLWASLHGLVVLTMQGRMAGGRARADELLPLLATKFTRPRG